MNTIYRWCVAILTTFSFFPATAQNQNFAWHFGDHAALTFSGGAPVPVLNSLLNTQEGCSSIADNTGALLFYTDGQTVYNRNNVVMTNGTGLLGNPSTTQSALIVPMPGSVTLYYVFTIDDLGGAMTYSIVDMAGAAGLGVVTTTKNVLLHASVCEKQCAVLRCDGNVWVLSHQANNNSYNADLVTASGISPSVVSAVGVSHAGGGGPFFNTVGQMKFSQQGDRVGVAIRDVAGYEVLDFDINTGVLSNPRSINFGSYTTAYGLEFSPDGTKLYGGSILGGRVYQFNLLAGSAAAIGASAVQVGLSANFTNSLQLGPDGKIYVAKSVSQTAGVGALDVINNPNALGTACGYVSGGQTLGGKLSLLGLPGFMVRPPVAPLNMNVTGPGLICAGQSVTLTATGATSYVWSGGSTDTTASTTVSPLTTTTYYVTGASNCGTDTDTITVQVDLPVNISVTTSDDTVCAGQSATLSASGSVSYQWSSSPSTGASINVSPVTTTTYYVSGTANACVADTDTITLYVDNAPVISITGTDSVCAGQSTTLTASGGTNYTWSGGSTATTDSIIVTPAVTTVYYASSTNGCGSDADTITVRVDSPVNISATASADSICSGQAVTLSATGSTSYQWSNSTSTAASITINPVSDTTYYVSGTANACATDTDTLTIYVEAIPSISVTGGTSVCAGQSATLIASGGNNYTWSGGSTGTTDSITVSPTVTTDYYVTSSSLHCGSDMDTVTVTVDTVSVITVSGTDTICAGQSATLLAAGGDTYAWATGQTTASITVTPLTTTTYSVTGSNGSCAASTATFDVIVNPLPVATITGANYICAGSAGIYTAAVSSGTSPYQYAWSTGATTSSVSITPTVTVTNLGVLVTDAKGCSDTSALTVTAVPVPTAIATASGPGCAPLTVNFFSESPNANSFEWHFGDGTTSNQQNPSHLFLNGGIYTVTLITTSLAGCSDTLVLSSPVTVYTTPIADISSTGDVYTDHTILTVYNHSLNADSCWLDYGDGSTVQGCNWSDAYHTYDLEGNYTVTQIVTTENGCSDTAVLHINATYESTFFAPNAITANHNGHNDIFYIYGTGLFSFHLTIYNRWGEMIYESRDQYQGWDGTSKGKEVEEGVYVWKVDYRTRRLGDEHKIGHVTVIR